MVVTSALPVSNVCVLFRALAMDTRRNISSRAFPLAFQVVPGLSLAIGIWFLQESPRWLMEKDRYDEARQALHALHYNGSNEEYLELEYREIYDTIIAEKQLAVRSWSGMVSKPAWRRRLAPRNGHPSFRSALRH